MTAPSAFLKYFVAQHGSRPSNLPIEKLVQIDSAARSAFESARYTLDQVELWEAQKTAALYAWNAAPKRKGRA